MKKIGLLGLALVLVLALTGAAFAKWSQTLYIEGTASTGTVEVGIRNTYTSDPPGALDPREPPGDKGPAKDVACTNSTNVDPKCEHDGVQYYEKVIETITNAYPYYAPTIKFAMANCGSIPVKIESIVCVITDPNDVFSDVTIEWKLTKDGSVVDSGTATSLSALKTQLETAVAPYSQIDPCHYLDFEKTIIFGEDTPQGKSMSFECTVIASQWNEVP